MIGGLRLWKDPPGCCLARLFERGCGFSRRQDFVAKRSVTAYCDRGECLRRAQSEQTRERLDRLLRGSLNAADGLDLRLEYGKNWRWNFVVSMANSICGLSMDFFCRARERLSCVAGEARFEFLASL